MSCHFTPKKVLSPIHLEFITKKCSLPIFWLLHPSTSTSLVKSFVHTFFFTLLLLHGWKCCFNIFLVFTSRAVTSSHPTPQSGRDAIIWADELLIWAGVVRYERREPQNFRKCAKETPRVLKYWSFCYKILILSGRRRGESTSEKCYF